MDITKTINDMGNLDFYKGFEGEAELIILEKTSDNKIKNELKLWYGYFDSILGLLMDEASNKEGLVKNYQTHSGAWFDNEEWECNNLELFISQLRELNISNILDHDIILIIDRLIFMISSAIKSDNKILFYYD